MSKKTRKANQRRKRKVAVKSRARKDAWSQPGTKKRATEQRAVQARKLARIAKFKAAVRKIADEQATYFAEVSEECGYKFCRLKVANDDVRDEFSQGLERVATEAQGPWIARLEAGEELTSEETSALTRAVAAATTAYNQDCIDRGVLEPGPFGLLEVPRARIYPDGRVEAASPHDSDVRAIAQRMQEMRDATVAL